MPAIKLWGVPRMPICQGCLLAGTGAALALGPRQLLEAVGRQKLELGRQKGAEAGICQQPHRALEGQVHHVAVVAPGEGPDLPLPSKGWVSLPLHAQLLLLHMHVEAVRTHSHSRLRGAGATGGKMSCVCLH